MKLPGGALRRLLYGLGTALALAASFASAGQPSATVDGKGHAVIR